MCETSATHSPISFSPPYDAQNMDTPVIPDLDSGLQKRSSRRVDRTTVGSRPWTARPVPVAVAARSIRSRLEAYDDWVAAGSMAWTAWCTKVGGSSTTAEQERLAQQ